MSIQQRVWNPSKDKRVSNVGRPDYDEAVERGWWLERRGGNLVEMVMVVFPTEFKDASKVVSKFGTAKAKVVSTPLETRGTFGIEEVHEERGWVQRWQMCLTRA